MKRIYEIPQVVIYDFDIDNDMLEVSPGGVSSGSKVTNNYIQTDESYSKERNTFLGIPIVSMDNQGIETGF